MKPEYRVAVTTRACDGKTVTERMARAAIGMPACHPERLTHRAGRREAQELAAWHRQCWPADEYIAIIRDTHPEDS